YRPLLRGRARAPVPHPARGEEPLRPGRRDRRLRDDGRRPGRGRQSLGALPLRAWAGRARVGRLRRDRGDAAGADRNPGPRRALAARHAAPDRRRPRRRAPIHHPRRARIPLRHPLRRSRRVPERRGRDARLGTRGGSRGGGGPSVGPRRRGAAPGHGGLRRNQPLRCPAPGRSGGKQVERGAKTWFLTGGRSGTVQDRDRRRDAGAQDARSHHVCRRNVRRGLRTRSEGMEGFTIVDAVVAVIILMSAILAYSRGFVREALAIAAWVAAAVLAFIFGPQAEPLVKQIPVLDKFLGDSCELSIIAAFAGVFALSLIVMSIFTPVFASAVQRSALGGIDQGLGFLFGVLRGILLVA